jgi:hypothetical protein
MVGTCAGFTMRPADSEELPLLLLLLPLLLPLSVLLLLPLAL